MIDAATDYALSVVQGRTPAGPLVIGACERHLAELTMQGTDGFPFVWRPDRLLKFTEFCLLLRQYKGSWKGFPLRLEPWQSFIFGSVFSWLHMDTGCRRFRTAYCEVPRKNGKSAMASAVALYLLMMDGEAGAEVYALATKRDQARIVYGDALKFLPAALRRKHLRTVTTETTHPASNSVMKPLAKNSRTLDGLSPHGGICDELHEWPDRALWDVIEDGMGARSQPIMFGITTAGHNKEGIAMTLRTAAKGLATDKGKRGFVLDSFFGYVACPTQADEKLWWEPRVWISANPNYGISKSQAFMQEQADTARVMPEKLNAFLNKQLNVWTDAASAWIPSDVWSAGAMDSSAINRIIAGRQCTGGLDIAKVTDLTSFCQLFRPVGDETDWIAVWHHWCPASKLEGRTDKDRVPYRQWARMGLITVTDGNATDLIRVGSDVAELCAVNPAKAVAFDRMYANETVQRLQGEGINMLEHGQGFVSMSPPANEIERLLISGRLKHIGCPLMSWQAGNAVISRDPAGNIKPDKAKSREKIDGIVALVMAMGAAMATGTVEEFSGEVAAVL